MSGLLHFLLATAVMMASSNSVDASDQLPDGSKVKSYHLDRVQPLRNGRYRVSNADGTQSVTTSDPNARFDITVIENGDGTITEEGRRTLVERDQPRSE